MDLRNAIENSNSKEVKELIKNKTVEEINTSINSSEDTLLNYAAIYNNIDIVKLLVEAGASVNIANDDDETPLHTAVYRGNIDIVKYLIEKDANIVDTLNTRDAIDLYTPLHLALSCPGPIEDEVTMKYLNIAELLIKKTTDKRNLETTDKRNNTPLLKLIGTSIRISIKDRYRGMENSELYTAALKLVNLLIKKRVNINAADNNRNTPLHRVLKNNDFELAHILMEAGADTELTNNKGKTPLQSIKTEGSNEDYDGADGLTRFKEFIYKRVRASKKLTRTLRSHATANITKKVYKMSKGTLPSELGEEVAKYIIGSPRHTYSRLTGKKRKKRKKSKRR